MLEKEGFMHLSTSPVAEREPAAEIRSALSERLIADQRDRNWGKRRDIFPANVHRRSRDRSYCSSAGADECVRPCVGSVTLRVAGGRLGRNIRLRNFRRWWRLCFGRSGARGRACVRS